MRAARGGGGCAVGSRRPLALLLALEVAVFGVFAERFFSMENAMEVVRSTTELGLVALAMTLVMKSGGIDLSVGSVLALGALSVGAALEAGVPAPLAVLAALACGLACGTVNGLFVVHTPVPPLVVTLATMALFRGIAEGWTGGYRVFSELPDAFLALGQGYVLGWLPAQLPLLALAAWLAWLALERTPFGRRVEAIGFSAEAARHAAVPVERCLLCVYALSGVAAAAAGVLYASHVGQAKADAGTGYELAVVTIVVLGGTSIFGGRGRVSGTLLGLFAIAVLQNGLLLAALPSELASILVGALLLASVLLEQAPRRPAEGLSSARSSERLDGIDMKNSQLAVLVAAILTGALIIAWSNARLAGALGGPPGRRATPDGVTVAMMPKNKSDPYFVSCRRGAEAAARELGIELIWDGPQETDAARQNEVVEAWITRGVDVIAVSVENAAALGTVLRKARERGIGVLTWDADGDPDSRDFFVDQATAEGIGFALIDEAGRILGGAGSFAIVTATLTAANQNAWIEHMRARMRERWPGLELAVIRPSDGMRDRALSETRDILRAYPEVELIVVIAAAAVPGAAEAVKQEGSSVPVIGLSVPSLCRDYVHAGIVESIVLWNTVDLGYLTVYAAQALHAGELAPGARAIAAGRLGEVAVAGDHVLLGEPFRFDATNIDRFDF